MGFFSNKKIEGLPQAPKEMRKVYTDPVTAEIEEKIDTGKTEGDYGEDKLSIELRTLKAEYEELNSRPDVKRLKKTKSAVSDIEDKISNLRSEIESSLLRTDIGNDDYHADIKRLENQEIISEYAKTKANTFGEHLLPVVNRMTEIKERIGEIEKQLKETYGNQDIKHVDGTYLN